MKQIIYTMHFKGQASPASADSKVMKATSSATSCTIGTTVGDDGVTGTFQAADGGLAFFESEVQLKSASSFLEAGTISFGENNHLLRFTTVGEGYLGPSADSKIMHGTVSWKVEGGEGQFAGATGLITSNFTLSDTGDVNDYHFGLIFLS